MLNTIPVIGWALSLLLAISLSIPFWFFWTVFGIGSTYFYFLPEVYQHPGFWDCVGLFIVVDILKDHIYPTKSSSSSSSSGK